MTMTATLFCADPDERRDSDRRPIARASTLRDAGERPHPVVVDDLSTDGCLVAHAGALAIGDHIQIGLPGIGRRAAAVVRIEGGRYGCRFDAPLPPAALLGAFAADPVVVGAFPGAFAADPVVVGAFPGTLAAALPEPAIAKWHPAVRLAVLIGSTVTLWAGIFRLM